jgi:hypothetical protein
LLCFVHAPVPLHLQTAVISDGRRQHLSLKLVYMGINVVICASVQMSVLCCMYNDVVGSFFDICMNECKSK